MKHAILVDPPLSHGSPIRSAQKGWTFSKFFIRITDRIHRWRMLSRERHLLMTLSDERLKDIGVTRADALQEAKRPFWDDSAIRR